MKRVLNFKRNPKLAHILVGHGRGVHSPAVRPDANFHGLGLFLGIAGFIILPSDSK